MNLRELYLKGWISAFLFLLLMPDLSAQSVVDCSSLKQIIEALDTQPRLMRGDFEMDYLSGESYWETKIQYDGMTGTYYPKEDGYMAELATYRILNPTKPAGVVVYMNLLTGDMEECLGSHYRQTTFWGPNEEQINVFYDQRDAAAADDLDWSSMKYPFVNVMQVPISGGAESYIDLEIAVP